MRLLLDLGNTRLKWALQERPGATWAAHGAVAWDEDVAGALAAQWAGRSLPRSVYAASVLDPQREQAVAASVSAAGGGAVQWVRTPAQACGVRNAYPEPERLGVDRFLAMVAARADGLGACVLVGVGTALTLDAMDAEGRHLGGLIAPGAPLMQQALVHGTARLRVERAGAVGERADNTADAVHSGCWLAVVALVERFVATLARELGVTPAVRLGGGDAEQLAALLGQPAQCVHDSVLRGLSVWAQAQSAPTTAP